MIGWGWLVLALFVGAMLGVFAMCLTSANKTSRDVERRNELGRALRDLYLADTDLETSYKDYDTQRMAALAQAKKVLGL